MNYFIITHKFLVIKLKMRVWRWHNIITCLIQQQKFVPRSQCRRVGMRLRRWLLHSWANDSFCLQQRFSFYRDSIHKGIYGRCRSWIQSGKIPSYFILGPLNEAWRSIFSRSKVAWCSFQVCFPLFAILWNCSKLLRIRILLFIEHQMECKQRSIQVWRVGRA